MVYCTMKSVLYWRGSIFYGRASTLSSDRFHSFDELRQHAIQDRDYRITVIERGSPVTVAAIHGGGIEPGTSELARAIAGEEFNCYLFEGLRPDSNEDLHISSIYFNEPRCLELLRSSQVAVTVHGCAVPAQVSYIGGRHEAVKTALISRFRQAGWVAHNGKGALSGSYLDNLCNRGQSGIGVQLEFSQGMRRSMFQEVSTQEGRKTRTAVFQQVIAAVREIILSQSLNQEDHNAR